MENEAQISSSSLTTETMILSSVIRDETFARKCLPYIKDEYFDDMIDRRIFRAASAFIMEYGSQPNQTGIAVALRNDQSLNETHTEIALLRLDEIFRSECDHNSDWVLNTTEKFCQQKSLYLAIHRSIAIYQGDEKDLTVMAIPDILKDALAVSFDTKIGLDFFIDAELRYEYYITPENKIPFQLSILNEVTCGGIPRKTFNVIVAGINVGKSMALVSMACDYMRSGLNVLYVSMEMREELIMQRVDANLMRVNVNDVAAVGKERFLNRVEVLRQKSYGSIRVKEFAPGMASAAHIRHSMEEMKLKQNFIPDVVIVDYVQITASSRMKYGQVGSYYYYKAVAEELRGLAVEKDIIVWSAAQFNRGGMNVTEPGMDDVGESTGIPATADGAWALIRTDELDQLGQIMWKQLKSRYANKAVKTRFVSGVNVEQQTLFDIEESAQPKLTQPEQARPMTGDQLRDRFMGMS